LCRELAPSRLEPEEDFDETRPLEDFDETWPLEDFDEMWPLVDFDETRPLEDDVDDVKVVKVEDDFDEKLEAVRDTGEIAPRALPPGVGG
jgi:hypothetical protein